MGPIIAVLALIAFFVLTRVLVLSLLRAASGPRRVTAAEAVAEAAGRPIVVGEHHADREGLRRIEALLAVAHERGIRTLGVEACMAGTGAYSGLAEEIDAIRLLGAGEIPEYDERSSLDPDATGRKPRMNRYWYVRAALALGWSVDAIDPHHWNWTRETAEGYIGSREPAMADAIRARGPMIAVVGYGHLLGLSALLGGDASFVLASDVRADHAEGDPLWKEPIAFAATLPRLEP